MIHLYVNNSKDIVKRKKVYKGKIKMSNSVEMLKKYIPYNQQEKADIDQIINAEKIFGNILTRENKFCHLTASAFIINQSHTKVLCIYHNIYKSWGWVGGHADGDDDLLFVAKKETKEETSLKNFTVLQEFPISVELLPVKSHVRKGEYVPAHTHLNVAFLLEANESDSIKILEDENSNIGWLTFEDLLQKTSEEHMKPIYEKIIEKIQNPKKTIF